MTTALRRILVVVAVAALVAGGIVLGVDIGRRPTASAHGTSTTTSKAPTPLAALKPLPTITLSLAGGHTPTWTGLKPSLIGFSGDSTNIVTGLEWQWGRSTAVGHGVWGYNDCQPYCAAGKITDYEATITLLDPAGGQFTALLEETGGPHGFVESYLLPAKAGGAPWTTTAPGNTTVPSLTPPPSSVATTVDPSCLTLAGCAAPVTTAGLPIGMPGGSATACKAIGGTPRGGGIDKWYILGPSYLPPACLNVPYTGYDGATYYLDLLVSTTGALEPSTAVGGATRDECVSGRWRFRQHGQNGPGTWDAALGLCTPPPSER